MPFWTRRRTEPPVSLAIEEGSVDCPLEQSVEAVEWCLVCPAFRDVAQVDGVPHVVCQLNPDSFKALAVAGS